MFSWHSFKLLYQRSYQLLLLQSALFISQYRKQRERITSLDLTQNQKTKNSCILRFHNFLRALYRKKLRASCTQASIARKRFTAPFQQHQTGKSQPIFLRDFPLKCFAKESSHCFFLTAPCTQPRIIDRKHKAHLFT